MDWFKIMQNKMRLIVVDTGMLLKYLHRVSLLTVFYVCLRKTPPRLFLLLGLRFLLLFDLLVFDLGSPELGAMLAYFLIVAAKAEELLFRLVFPDALIPYVFRVIVLARRVCIVVVFVRHEDLHLLSVLVIVILALFGRKVLPFVGYVGRELPAIKVGELLRIL